MVLSKVVQRDVVRGRGREGERGSERGEEEGAGVWFVGAKDSINIVNFNFV